MFRRSPPGRFRILGFATILALASASAARADTITLPAAASIVGGAPFYSDVRAFNTSYDVPLTVQAVYHCFIGNPCPDVPRVQTFFLSPRESRAFDDMVAAAFLAPNTAGGVEFQFVGDASLLVVTSRLYSTSPTPTVGMFIPGLTTSAADLNTVLTSIRNRGSGAGFRTNVGVFNPTNGTASVTFRISDELGNSRGQPVSQFVAAHSGLQVSGIFGAAGVAGYQTANAVITVSASAPVFSYAAVIDNATTDPIFVVGSRDAPPRPPTATRTATNGPSPTFTATPGGPIISRTPTPTGTALTASPSATRTSTPTAGTPTATFTASASGTPFTPSITPTRTRTLSPTITFTATQTFTPTLTFTVSRTPTNSRTPTSTATFTATRTSTPSFTATRTLSATPTLSATATVTTSRTPTSTTTGTATATVTPTPNPNHVVFVGQGGGLTFIDSSSGTSTTTVTAGTTVEWSWITGLHTTTSGTCSASNCVPDFLWDSGQHASPFTYTRTFSTAGTFPYFCTVHGVAMQGLVNVLP